MHNQKENKTYKTTNIVVSSNDDLYAYCKQMALAAKLFSNAVTFRCRQLFSAYFKKYANLTENEQQVIDEFAIIGVSFPSEHKHKILPNYYEFDKMFKQTQNPDYFNVLPSQTTQQTIKMVLESFKAYSKSLKAYYKDASKFAGKPRLPGYIKTDITTFTITNQEAYVKDDNTLKLPKTKLTVNLGKLNINRLIEVTIQPFYDDYKISIVEKVEPIIPKQLDATRVLGIDLGVTNIVSTSNNCGLVPFVINGNGLKAYNQWYNKTKAKLQSQLPQGKHSSHSIDILNKHHYNRTNDFYNKVASYIIHYCIDNNIGTIVIGKNTQWKQNINIGHKNNQTFCFIAHSTFIDKIKLMADTYGIAVIITEESYTSKASFLDNDDIPTYDNNNAEHKFSGRRKYRGLYQSKDGYILNADINGASNIIKKGIKSAFDNINDFAYLYQSVNKIQIT